MSKSLAPSKKDQKAVSLSENGKPARSKDGNLLTFNRLPIRQPPRSTALPGGKFRML